MDVRTDSWAEFTSAVAEAVKGGREVTIEVRDDGGYAATVGDEKAGEA